MTDRPGQDLPPFPPVVAAEQLATEGEVAIGTAPTGIPGRERSDTIRRVIVYIVLFFVALLFFVPFFWSVTTSLKTLPESVGFNFLPENPSIRAYRQALSAYDFNRYFLNSVFLSVVVTMSTLFLASLGGYAFARLRFPGREALFFLVLATLMIPNELRLVPVFQMLVNFPVLHVNLLGTYQGYFAINLVSATSLFLMRQYFLTIPKDYEEAAKLDSAGFFKTYWKVMLPLAGPAIAAITILSFQGTWNDFYWQLLLLQDEKHFTLNVGIARFATSGGFKTDWPALMAVSIIAIAPVAVLYVFFQRYFVAGVTTAGVKG